MHLLWRDSYSSHFPIFYFVVIVESKSFLHNLDINSLSDTDLKIFPCNFWTPFNCIDSVL